MKSRPSFADLIAFNIAVIGQGRALAQHYFEHAAAFGNQVGPHLRHIIEHYEALLHRRAGELFDYDPGSRDRTGVQPTVVAARRLNAIAARLTALGDYPPHTQATKVTTEGIISEVNDM